MVLIRSPDGMQNTMQLHLNCPTIMIFRTCRFMPLIPRCKLIIIHPLFGLSTCIAVVASYIHDDLLCNLWIIIWVDCKYSCHTILASKAHLCQVPSHDTVALSQSGVSDQHNPLSSPQEKEETGRKGCYMGGI